MVGLHQGQAVAHFPDQRDAGLAQAGLDDDAGFVEHGAEVGHDGLAVGGGAQAGGGDLFQALNQGAQHVVLIVALNREVGREAGVSGGGGGGEIADLVRDGADQDARGGHHRIEARAFAIAQALAGIPDHGGEAGALRGVVGGEPHVGQEDIAIAAVRLGFHVGAQVGVGARALEHAVEDRQVRRHIAALQRFVVEAEQLARRFVGESDAAGLIQREDGQRAGFDQDADLLLGLLAQADLALALRQMFRQIAPALVQLGDEETGHGVARHDDGDAFGSAGSEPQGVEGLAQEAAAGRHQQDLPGVERGRRQKNRKQIEEADGDVEKLPVHPGDARGQQGGDATDGEAARFRVREKPI